MAALLKKIRDTLAKISVSGYENIKRMGVVMEALDEMIRIAEAGAVKEDVNDHQDEHGEGIQGGVDPRTADRDKRTDDGD